MTTMTTSWLEEFYASRLPGTWKLGTRTLSDAPTALGVQPSQCWTLAATDFLALISQLDIR